MEIFEKKRQRKDKWRRAWKRKRMSETKEEAKRRRGQNLKLQHKCRYYYRREGGGPEKGAG